MGIIFTRYVHCFGYSDGRGHLHSFSCTVKKLAQFFTERAVYQSRSLGAGHCGNYVRHITSFLHRYAWSTFSPSLAQAEAEVLNFSSFRTLTLSFFMEILAKIHLLLFKLIDLDKLYTQTPELPRYHIVSYTEWKLEIVRDLRNRRSWHSPNQRGRRQYFRPVFYQRKILFL